MGELSLRQAGLISTSVQAMLYGFSVLMFFLTMWILVRRRQNKRVNYGMMLAACSLIFLATCEMVVNIIRICQGFINVGPTLPGGPEQYFSDFSQLTFVMKSCLYNTQTLILDAVVIYRAYVVWQTIWVVVVPILGWFGLLAASIGINVSLATASQHANSSIFAAEAGKWITATYAMTLATNLLSSSLLAFRIWQISSRTSQYRSSNILGPVLRAVIESGLIYSFTITAALITFVIKSPGVYVLLDMISPIISIVFNLIIITVGIAAEQPLPGLSTYMASNTANPFLSNFTAFSPTESVDPTSPHSAYSRHHRLSKDFAVSGNSGNGGAAMRSMRPAYEMKKLAVEITRYQETYEDTDTIRTISGKEVEFDGSTSGSGGVSPSSPRHSGVIQIGHGGSHAV